MVCLSPEARGGLHGIRSAQVAPRGEGLAREEGLAGVAGAPGQRHPYLPGRAADSRGAAAGSMAAEASVSGLRVFPRRERSPAA